jgi:hypothetical protein
MCLHGVNTGAYANKCTSRWAVAYTRWCRVVNAMECCVRRAKEFNLTSSLRVVGRLANRYGGSKEGWCVTLLDVHVSVWPVQEVRITADPQKSYLPQWLSSPLGMTSAPSQTFQRGRPPIPPVRSSSSVHSSDDSELSMPIQVGAALLAFGFKHHWDPSWYLVCYQI